MLTINSERLLADLDELAQIGATPEGGVSRPALSEADLQARDWFRRRTAAAGLDYAEDGAGNQSALLRGADDSRRLVAGSHLDSVPDGGRFDGSLGTLAALEALRTLREAGYQPPVTLEAISFTDEEGTLMGLLGSRAVAGALQEADFTAPRGGRDRLLAGMQRAGLTEASIQGARRGDIAGFVELHIEQGTRLEGSGTDIGVVTAIVGIRSVRMQFMGRAAHAGTTPMDQRQDALWGASDLVQQAKTLVMAKYSPGVVNFGIAQAYPGAFNIVPARVELGMEFRHGSQADLDAMEADLLALARSCAQTNNLTLEMEKAVDIVPAPMDEQVIEAIENAAAGLGLSHTRLMSFAGHDTQSIAAIAPAAMLFIPSVGGVSHHPDEYSHPEDVVNGANVVLHTLLNLCEAQG